MGVAARTHACCIDTRLGVRASADATQVPRRSHGCERCTQKCVRHMVHAPLMDGPQRTATSSDILDRGGGLKDATG
jgi:hypothetical protein